MSPSQVVHLHSHSEYSLLDGACRIDRMAARAAELGMPALGLTDHGVMNGAVELYKACRKHEIKPILGLEAYLVDDHRARGPERYERNHLTLLASSDEGFRNLVKLSSAGFLEGFRRGKANLDLELIARHSEGIICLTGCLQSRLCRRLVEDRPADARTHADDLLQLFGPDDVYFEVQNNKIPDQDKANQGIVRIAGEVGRPLVGTADVHYLRREDYHHHAALLCVQTKSTLAEPKLSFDTNEFFLKSPEEMADSFAAFPGAVETTLEVAERCNVEIELGKILLPRFDAPAGQEPAAYLRELAEQGLERRYGSPPPAAARERLDSELGIIGEMGFDSYFLIVWDFVRYAKQEGIAVGPGRGSAAGSIVAYCLDITEVDPLTYDLLFERFLNPARRTMPDMDIDFSVKGRDRVIRYVQDKYGEESVAQIITFGTMAPRAASRDAARVLGHDYALGDRIAKLVPDPMQGRNPTFADCLADPKQLERREGESDSEWGDRKNVNKQAEPLRQLRDSDPQAAKVLEVAQGLEGIVRNSSVHAAGVVIADRPLSDLVPVQLAEVKDADAPAGERSYKRVTQYSMKPVEEIGLLKMDFLGLRNLDVLEDAVGVIERSRGERLDLERLPLDDPRTYAMLAEGDSVGVFQFESEGMQKVLRQVKPTEFEDLVALVALYRPGPMRFIEDYAKGKRDPRSVTYTDPRLEPITGATYGIPIYQEQLMEIAKRIAGFSGSEADELRRAIGKKIRKLMASMESKFMEGCAGTGTKPAVGRELWKLMEAAADYSFNRSHAASYALISYRTAYLKANYPVEYMAALISTVMNTKDKVPFFVNRCKEMGIEVLPPDVNASEHDFVVVEGSIRFGLDAVKNVGYAAVEKIVAAREAGGPFESVWDFCARVDSHAVNKRAVESLVKCGGLDSTGDPRRGMLDVLPQALGAGQRAQQDALSGQGSIFELDDGGDAAASPSLGSAHPPVPDGEFPKPELLRLEQETLGYFVTEHPLTAVRAALRARCDCTLAELGKRPDGSWVTVGGLITEVKRIRTKSGDPMLFATLDDLEGTVEMLVFNSAYASNEGKVDAWQIVTVRGRVDHKDRGETKLVAQEVEVFEPTAEEVEKAGRAAPRAPAGPLRLRVEAAGVRRSIIQELITIFEHNPGEAEVELEMLMEQGSRRLRFGREHRVAPGPQLQAELDSLLGPNALVR